MRRNACLVVNCPPGHFTSKQTVPPQGGQSTSRGVTLLRSRMSRADSLLRSKVSGGRFTFASWTLYFGGLVTSWQDHKLKSRWIIWSGMQVPTWNAAKTVVVSLATTARSQCAFFKASTYTQIYTWYTTFLLTHQLPNQRSWSIEVKRCASCVLSLCWCLAIEEKHNKPPYLCAGSQAVLVTLIF